MYPQPAETVSAHWVQWVDSGGSTYVFNLAIYTLHWFTLNHGLILELEFNLGIYNNSLHLIIYLKI